MPRIVLNTFGSYGDLHPYLALAIGLRDRGHNVVVGTSEVYRSKVEGEGIEFAPVRPDVGELAGNAEFARKLWHPVRGSEFLLREYLIPNVKPSFDDLMLATQSADLLLTHAAAYAGPIVAEVRKLRWISVALQPLIFMSTWDPSVLPGAPWFHNLARLGRGPYSALFAIAKTVINRWAEPIQQSRLELGLARSAANPILEGQFSPVKTLALFSEKFAAPQPDWPANSLCTGFCFYDRQQAGLSLDPGLRAFLENGSPPVIFTLGSSAVFEPGSFYQESLEVARSLNIRAVLLVGPDSVHRFTNVPETVHVAAYAPYSELFPRASAVVHQGGIGTTAQTLRAGRPMLIVPWSHDQPDNAARIERLSVGRKLARSRYRAATAAAELQQLLNRPDYSTKAAQLGNAIQTEDGVTAACNQIEGVLAL